jgi:hypothetical protein
MTEQEFNDLASIKLIGEDSGMIEDFCLYWTEKSINGRKMRFEKEKVFDIKRRFNTWKRNANRFKPATYTNHISGTINAYDNVVRRLNNENNS